MDFPVLYRQSSRKSQKVANRKIELIFFRPFCTLQIVRLLAEILVVGALIYLGWEQPFKERIDQARVKVTGKQAPVAPKEMTPTRTPAPRIVPGIIREPTPPLRQSPSRH
jgi:hypothetical protein